MATLNFVLHAHLPFVRHPEHARFLEEEWLYEAITETYLPLLREFDALERDGIPFRLTLGLTPPLCEMLADELLQNRYAHHLNRLRELAEKECARLKHDARLAPLAAMYRNRFEQCHLQFEALGRNLLNGFRRHRDRGHLEILTCGATHGFAPNLRHTPRAAEAQLAVAARNHEKHFGAAPQGIWLGECGYYPGLDRLLRDAGLRYFFTDTHALSQADPPSPAGCYAPVETPSGVYAFARDPESSKAVWSADEGYPGDARYREFYRDIGHELPMEYIAPYIHPMGLRIDTGIKYHRITGRDVEKDFYDEARAREALEAHAENFLFNRDRQAEWLDPKLAGPGGIGAPACIVCPYDAELFGHWWYEGPQFLGAVLRKAASGPHGVTLASPRDWIDAHAGKAPRAQPAFSSWGAGGYAEVWLNGTNDWIYPHLHRAAERMRETANLPEGDALDRRARNQMARELLLAQSSDWAFIMKTGTMVDYAVRRTKVHVRNVLELGDQIAQGRVDEGFLRNLERTDNIFPEIDYGVYRG